MWPLNPWLRSLIFTLLPCALIAEVPRSVGIVAERSGEILWEGGGALRLFDDIPPLKGVILAKGARLTILTLETGDELVFQGPARLHFTSQGFAAGSNPLERRKVPAPLRGALGFKPGTLAQAGVVMRAAPRLPNRPPDAAAKAAPEAPLVMILGPSYTFRWRGSGAGVIYRLRVWDALDELLFHRETPETALVLPEGVTLAENETYRWTADAMMEGRILESQSGRVALLSKTQRQQLEQARPGPEASFAQRLLFGSLLEHLLLRDEARKHWSALAQERPLDPVLQKLASSASR